MYIPNHFTETRPEELARIMRAYPLGILVTQSELGLDANHIPFEYESDPQTPGKLIAHVARANPLWQQCPSGTKVLVVFRGADAYISPNWYPSKREAHRQVPTWNYEVVHAHGVMTVLEDERFLRRVVSRLTQRHEATEPKPWKMGDAPPDYIDGMLKSIVGIEIEITSITGKVKLSQNKDERDRMGVVDALRTKGNEKMAEAIKNAT